MMVLLDSCLDRGDLGVLRQARRSGRVNAGCASVDDRQSPARADPSREFFLDLLFCHCLLHRYVVFELKLGRFEPKYVGKLNFYVQLVDDDLRDEARDDPNLGILLVVGRDDVTVEVALRGVGTPLAVSEWRRLPTKVRQALPSAEDISATVTRTVREIESAAPAALHGRGPPAASVTLWPAIGVTR